MAILHEKVAKLHEKRAQMQGFPSNTLEVKKGKAGGEVRKLCKLLKSGVWCYTCVTLQNV